MKVKNSVLERLAFVGLVVLYMIFLLFAWCYK